MSRDLPRQPLFRLDGQRALVTGASRGIGRAAAVALSGAGAEVLLGARSVGECEETATTLRAKGLMARALALDVTDRVAVRRVVDAEGPFDVLVNNAGTNIRESVVATSDETVDRLLDLNVRAAFTVAQAVVKGMLAAGRGGSIINTGSVNGFVAGPNRALYTATKHAVEGLTKAMAYELTRHGIRVNSLCPGFVETPLTVGVLSDPAFRREQEAGIPLGRILTVEDLMGGFVFLASPA
ncbi:MAG TPA: SDR family oxidoreductase, partial [Acetobacteraceae bacterium]|nr:SDR family oxidoreductase [Acetobacteraceae bacterium]